MAGGDEVDDEATACEACSRTLCSATNEMLLCDADGCQNAYHMRCLKPSLASVPEGEWICPSCEDVDAPIAGWRKGQELTMSLAAGDKLWARDKRGLWAQAVVRALAMQPAKYGQLKAVGISYVGFPKKWDETIELGAGRLRPWDIGAVPYFMEGGSAKPGKKQKQQKQGKVAAAGLGLSLAEASSSSLVPFARAPPPQDVQCQPCSTTVLCSQVHDWQGGVHHCMLEAGHRGPHQVWSGPRASRGASSNRRAQ